MASIKTALCIGCLLLAATQPAVAEQTRGGFAPAQPSPKAALPGPARPSLQPRGPQMVPPQTGSLKATAPLQGNLTPGALVFAEQKSVCKTIPPFEQQLNQQVRSKVGNAVREILIDMVSGENKPKGIYLNVFTTELQSYAGFVRGFCCGPHMTYSVQDQKSVGCQSNETLGSCMNKLTTWCAKDLEGKKLPHYGTKSYFQNDINRLQNAITALTQLKQTMEKMRNAIP